MKLIRLIVTGLVFSTLAGCVTYGYGYRYRPAYFSTYPSYYYTPYYYTPYTTSYYYPYYYPSTYYSVGFGF